MSPRINSLEIVKFLAIHCREYEFQRFSITLKTQLESSRATLVATLPPKNLKGRTLLEVHKQSNLTFQNHKYSTQSPGSAWTKTMAACQ